MAKKQEEEKPAPSQAEVFAEFIDGLVQNSTITEAVAGIIKHAIAAKFK